MRRADLDRQRAERRRANTVERARVLARKHRDELDRLLKSEAPATFLQRDMAAAYAEEIATPEPTSSGEDRFLATAAQFPIDPDLITRVEQRKGEVLSMGHHFIGVAGHPDDDECTYREDGTDRTYCGRTEGEHYPEPTDSEVDRG
jgi:hypothetical protein